MKKKKRKDTFVPLGPLYIPTGFYKMVTNKRKVKEQKKYGLYAVLVIFLVLFWFYIAPFILISLSILKKTSDVYLLSYVSFLISVVLFIYTVKQYDK